MSSILYNNRKAWREEEGGERERESVCVCACVCVCCVTGRQAVKWVHHDVVTSMSNNTRLPLMHFLSILGAADCTHPPPNVTGILFSKTLQSSTCLCLSSSILATKSDFSAQPRHSSSQSFRILRRSRTRSFFKSTVFRSICFSEGTNTHTHEIKYQLH